MLTAPLKIGIAAACLVAVAVLIAVDASRTSSPPPAAPSAPVVITPLQAAYPPPGVVLAAPAAETVICPAPAEPAKKAEEVASPKAPEPVPAKIEPPKVYTVLQGDSLYGISVKLFGTPRHYERIYEANRDRIKDPNTLQVGINLRMPELPASAK